MIESICTCARDVSEPIRTGRLYRAAAIGNPLGPFTIVHNHRKTKQDSCRVEIILSVQYYRLNIEGRLGGTSQLFDNPA
jgi:hypothetical protein